MQSLPFVRQRRRCAHALPQALLERAVGAPATRSSPLLWRVYVAHELAAGRPDAARRIFLRAVHACAWAKARPCPDTCSAALPPSIRARGMKYAS